MEVTQHETPLLVAELVAQVGGAVASGARHLPERGRVAPRLPRNLAHDEAAKAQERVVLVEGGGGVVRRELIFFVSENQPKKNKFVVPTEQCAHSPRPAQVDEVARFYRSIAGGVSC